MSAGTPTPAAGLSYKKSLVIIAAGAAYLVGQYFLRYSPYPDLLGWPLITLGQMLAIIWFLIWLASERTYRLWLKVSAVYIPLALILTFAIYPVRFTPDAEVAPLTYGVYPFGALYILITLLVALWGFWRDRRAARPAS